MLELILNYTELIFKVGRSEKTKARLMSILTETKHKLDFQKKPPEKVKDRFKPHFCERDFYLQHQPQFQIIHDLIKNEDQINQLTLWILSTLCLRRPKNWLAQVMPLESNVSFAFDSKIKVYDLFQTAGIGWSDKISKDLGLSEFCNQIKIKPLPKTAHSALFHFQQRNYPMIITQSEPSPYELLDIQIGGKRVVTFEPNFKLWPDLMYEKRDPLSFWIHDLIHAEHFFESDLKKHSQIAFYKFAKDVSDLPSIQNLLQSEAFAEKFHYIISDMNSHPLHLMVTLKAVIHLETQNNLVWEEIVSHYLNKSPKGLKIQQLLINIQPITLSEHDANLLTETLLQL